MVNIGITKMSSKGQIVIPFDMRSKIKEGEKLLIIQGKDNFVLKKASKMDEQLEEDLEFARQTEEAWKRHDKGKFIHTDVETFLNLKKRGY